MIKSYKAFNKDMTCRGFQYEIGKEYEEKDAEACKCGFHACEYPLDCFSYYTPSKSEFCEVEQSGKISKSTIDTKISSSKIKIGAKLDIAGLVKAAIEFTKAKAIDENDPDSSYCVSSTTEDCGVCFAKKHHSASSATGDCSVSSVTGDCSASSATGNYCVSVATGSYSACSTTEHYSVSAATGDCSVSSATGDDSVSSTTGYKGASSATGGCSVSSVTGDCSASSATGDYSISSATGYKGASSATGDYDTSSTTGDCSVSSATGSYSVSSTTGYKGASSVTGDYSVSIATGSCSTCSAENPTAIAVAWGYKSRAKGVIGSYITCTEWKENGEDNWVLVQAKMVQVDGEKIKADTYYELIDGEFVEAKD